MASSVTMTTTSAKEPLGCAKMEVAASTSSVAISVCVRSSQLVVIVKLQLRPSVPQTHVKTEEDVLRYLAVRTCACVHRGLQTDNAVSISMNVNQVHANMKDVAWIEQMATIVIVVVRITKEFIVKNNLLSPLQHQIPAARQTMPILAEMEGYVLPAGLLSRVCVLLGTRGNCVML